MRRFVEGDYLGPGPRVVRALLLVGFLLHDLSKLWRRLRGR